ncbi:Ltp family lipoprotein [Ammonicoccus fulvus]|uniref:Ltp family lipoprotein n=1 Tax=Ammonicoccus fulvus TaxID=3138240 RepID=A0ABZ3FSQ9_9ACTN
MTVSQRQAVRKANDYLDYSAFSRKGLIDQLEYEGFSTADATFAVDNIKVDWNEQAAKKAQDYLDYSAFSRQSLIDQLEYEGFTTKQAEHGVKAVGL